MNINLVFANLMTRGSVITEDKLIGVELSSFTDDQLQQLLHRSIGYAEDIILFEFESREEN